MATSDGRTATGGPSGSLKGDFIVRDTADPTGRQLYSVSGFVLLCQYTCAVRSGRGRIAASASRVNIIKRTSDIDARYAPRPPLGRARATAHRPCATAHYH